MCDSDPDTGETYLLWKTDDNSLPPPAGLKTRIWAQQVELTPQRQHGKRQGQGQGPPAVKQLGQPKEIMDSAGLWWVDSWVAGGTLVEGPELVKHNGTFFLFFAAGKYCQPSYCEGVARSDSIWGPYEKMPTPLLSTSIVGTAATGRGGEAHWPLAKLVGPGHASFVQAESETGSGGGGGDWFAVWHASKGQNCNRFGFVDKMVFGADGWPRIEF
eukprot:SAG22_NODE_976_length_6199_cov_1.414426_5_plen_215_part_00